MDISHILNELNEKQREAVTADLTHMRILAGAGSGKTRVLVYRIAWLIEVENLSPFNILAVTFTNKAAKEMQYRIQSMVGPIANNMWVGTFHGLAHRLLRLHWQEAGLPQNFQVIDSDDQYRVIRRIMKSLELDEAKWPPKQAQWYVNNKKEEGIRVKGLSTPYGQFDAVMQRVYQQYEALCEQSGLVDFSELLFRSYELFSKREDVREHYQQRFQVILVDEFQDTNRLQYAWLKLLAGQKGKLIIVGDDDQSIYSWRGACVDNMHQFAKDFSGLLTIRLEQNYRSSGHILKAANQLIANNEDRLGKELWTSADSGDLIHLYAAFNDLDEARFIMGQIKAAKEAGHKLADCAILYRSNAQSRVLEEALIQSQILYRIYGGLRFFERAEIKDALGYLRLIENQHDDSAFERIVNTPTRGIGERTLVLLREMARNEQQSLWHSVKKMAAQGESRAQAALQRFVELIETLIAETEPLPLYEQIEHILAISGLKAHYQKEKGEKGRARVENLEELISAARFFDNEEENMSDRAAFVTHAALEAGETQAAEHHDCVQLMTVHSAKGLEFPVVFLAGMEEGLFPHQMSIEENKDVSEERRLCYVGMTRAMKKLYLCYAESRYLYGKEKIQRPSRFLAEIPAECVEEVRLRTHVSMPVTRTVREPVDDGTGTLRAGQTINHNTFGEGVVLNVEGSGAKARVHIRFVRAGTKWLMAEYVS